MTLEKIFENSQQYVVRSVGTSPKARRKITQSDLHWADVILCMEQKHQEIIEQQFGKTALPKMIVLDIPDDYLYMEPDLVEILTEKMSDVFHEEKLSTHHAW